MLQKTILAVTFALSAFAASSQNQQKIDSLQHLVTKETSQKAIAYLYSLIAEEYYFNYPDSALKYSYIGMSYSKRNNDITDLAFFHNVIGVIYKNKSVYDSAIFHYQEAIKYNLLDTFYSGVAANLNNIGQVYLQKGDYDKALTNYLKSLQIFEAKNDTLNIGELHSNIGALMIEINEFDAAEEHFNLSRKQYIMAGAQMQEAWIMYDLGNLKLKTGKPNEALVYFNESAKVWEKFDRIKGYYTCMLRIGEIMMINGNYSEAEKLFAKSRLKLAEIDNQQSVAESMMLMGRAQFQQKKFILAIGNLRGALKLSNSFNSNQMKLNAYFDLYQCYKSLNNTDSALYFLENYKHLNDTIFSETRNQLMAEYQIKLKLNTKEVTIKQLRDKAQQQELINENILLKNQQNEMGIYALIFLVVLTGLFLFSLFRRNRKTLRLNTNLQAALKEREVLIREVHHRVKNNLQIISSLLNLQSEKTEGHNPKEILQISQSRIEAMSMIHENLYKSANLSKISFREYVDNLCKYIETSFSLSEKKIDLQRSIDDIEVDIDQLVPCGLIMNELVTNSIKHAFDIEDNKLIRIVCIQKGDKVRIEIGDNGKGLPEDFDVLKTKSLGMRLSQGLARQLKSELKYGNNNGFKAWFEFNNEKK
jgi:two-component sensor histidine kinase